MKIASIFIKNFRGIGEGLDPISFGDFNLLIGDNGTSKTSIIEAINLCLSSGYAASRISLKDFHQGGDKPIELRLTFAEAFDVEIPDLFANTQVIKCNGVALVAKKRDRSAPGKAFNDLVVAEHYYCPVEPRGEDGWTITRKNQSTLKISERNLALSNASSEIPRSFYFDKERNRQLQKGYNSSISNVLDDLNWRFEKGQRAKGDADKFKHVRSAMEQYVLDNTDGDTLKKTIEETNKTLQKLAVPKVDLSLIKTLTPYDSTDVVTRFDGFELPIKLSGSGIEMVVALVFLETLARISKSAICIIIDEPELHLHPVLQDKVASYLEEISKSSQVFISTHSPFFFKNCFSNPGTQVLVSETKSGNLTVSDAKNKGFGLLKWSPSWGEICYFAYDLPTAEFHDDLYASLQDKNLTSTIAATEAWLLTKGEIKEVKWTNAAGVQQEETLMTYIRNRMHHGDNQNRPMYSPDQLRDSIQRMLKIL